MLASSGPVRTALIVFGQEWRLPVLHVNAKGETKNRNGLSREDAQQHNGIVSSSGMVGEGVPTGLIFCIFVKILTSIDDSNILLIERSKTIDPRNERIGVRRYFLHVETSETDQQFRSYSLSKLAKNRENPEISDYLYSNPWICTKNCPFLMKNH